MPVLFGEHNLPPLVEVGLTDLPKYEGAMGGLMAPPAPLKLTNALLRLFRSTKEIASIKKLKLKMCKNIIQICNYLNFKVYK